MRYVKGSFLIIPNKDVIRGQQPSIQAVYFWICSYLDGNGTCYPSIRKIAEGAGVSTRTVHMCIKSLEELGLLEKTERYKDNEQTTNKYQVLLIDKDVDKDTPPETIAEPPATNSTTSPARVAHRTESNLNSIYSTINSPVGEENDVKEIGDSGFPLPSGWTEINHGLSDDGTPQVEVKDEFGARVSPSRIKKLRDAYLKVPPVIKVVSQRKKVSRGEFSFATELEKLRVSTWTVHKIIALIWKRKGYNFENWKQFDAQLARDTKPASTLDGYSGKQISLAIEACQKESARMGYDWGVSTVAKKIANVVNQ